MNKAPSQLDEELGVSIYDHVTGSFSTVLRVALERTSPRSHVLALFDIFGQETFLKFLDVFAGTRVDVPSKAKLEDALKQTTIYLELIRTSPGQRSARIKELARKYRMTAGDVRKVFVELDALFKDRGFLLPT